MPRQSTTVQVEIHHACVDGVIGCGQSLLVHIAGLGSSVRLYAALKSWGGKQTAIFILTHAWERGVGGKLTVSCGVHPPVMGQESMAQC